MYVNYKHHDSQRISGPSLLEVTSHQRLGGMRPIVSTVDALYTNAALPHISGDLVYHRCCCCKILRNATSFCS